VVPTWLQSIVLGVVQGITEFVPVSSSGHLVLVPYLLAWERPGLAFDVALHVGTIGAILAYFRAELWGMARGLVLGDRSPDGGLYRRLVLLLAIGTIPVAVVGVLLLDFFAEVFETPPAAAGALFVTAGVLTSAEWLRSRRVTRAERQRQAATSDERPRTWSGDWVGDAPAPQSMETVHLQVGEDADDPVGRTLADIGLREALIVGCFQVLALFPGISRSGVTITGGIAAGLTREAATRFSFLLALPAMTGAAVVTAPDLRQPDIYSRAEIALGVLAALVAGYLAIRFLVAFVSRERLLPFAKYCVVAGAIALAAWYMIG
jgi:undecaprenyl-diphosphatase